MRETGLKANFPTLPVSVRRLRSPSLSYVNFDILPPDIDCLDMFGWLIPDEHSPTSSECSSHFLSDIYGGTSILRHGGGVRTAIYDQWSVKGIGVNEYLLGKDSGSMYLHGGMALFECIQEALLGEALHIALPFGASRPLACIDSGLMAWWDNDQPQKPKRGLLVRQNVTRPAHFMRAPYFLPTNMQKAALPSDVERTRKSIEVFPEYLRSLKLKQFSKSRNAALDPEEVWDAIRTLMFRHAEQIAAATVRKILHGSLGPSNLALDGRWVDFGSATFLPNYGSLRFMRSLWQQIDALPVIFRELLFYFKKYHPQGSILKRFDFNELVNATFREYFRCVALEFSIAAGVPSIFLVRPDEEQQLKMQAFSTVAIRIAKAGQDIEMPFCGYPDETSRFGLYKVESILHALAKAALHGQFDTPELEGLISDAALRRELCNAYFGLQRILEKKAKACNVSNTALRRHMYLGSRRRIEQAEDLYRGNLIKATIDLVENRHDHLTKDVCAQYFNRVLDKVWRIHKRGEGELLPCWKQDGQELYFDLYRDCWQTRQGLKSGMYQIQDFQEEVSTNFSFTRK